VPPRRVPSEASPLDLFHAPVARWFRAALGEPTAAQERADVATAQISESVTDEMVQDAESADVRPAGPMG